MHSNQTHSPTADEIREQSLTSYRGIELGLGQADPMADVSAQLEQKYPGHIIVVQAGKFLHCYDRSAYALSMLKKYKLVLAGPAGAPHLRCGFPIGNFQKRLWPLVQDFQIPYVVYLGSRADGYTAYVSNNAGTNVEVLAAVSDQIVLEVIAELIARGRLNQTSTAQLLANPDGVGFKLKTQAQELDTHLLHDITNMSRDLRGVYGENLRACMARVMPNVFAYGTAPDKASVLRQLSADIDLLKHYMAQAPGLKKLKFAFDHRAGLAVELGRLVGGLIKKPAKVPA